MTTFPARLHVLLASRAPVGLVIRRGPAKQVATLLWDRKRDEFKLGQWLKGKIYERRSDLSPDGKLFLYFAMNGEWHREAKGSWTAISHAPYLRASTLFPWGNSWYGGGLWTGRSTYWLNTGWNQPSRHDNKVAKQDTENIYPNAFGGECPGVYYHRLIRDGWTLANANGSKLSSIDIFIKPLPNGWILRKFAHSQISAKPGKGCYWDEHELIPPGKSSGIRHPDWEWAELDAKRLVWASGGKLFAGQLRTTGLVKPVELHDFNNMKFQAIKAPY